VVEKRLAESQPLVLDIFEHKTRELVSCIGLPGQQYITRIAGSFICVELVAYIAEKKIRFSKFSPHLFSFKKTKKYFVNKNFISQTKKKSDDNSKHLTKKIVLELKV
jgi:hypothetical protein